MSETTSVGVVEQAQTPEALVDRAIALLADEQPATAAGVTDPSEVYVLRPESYTAQVVQYDDDGNGLAFFALDGDELVPQATAEACRIVRLVPCEDGEDYEPAPDDANPVDVVLAYDVTTPYNARGDKDQPEPTHTLEQYRAVLAKWGKLCDDAAERNYHAALLAHEAVVVYLGTHPGAAQRITAVSELAKRLAEADPDYYYPPKGKSPDAWTRQCMDKARHHVLRCVHAGAMLRTLFNATVDEPVLCGDGQCRKAGTRAAKAVPWRRVRELLPLVQRLHAEDEFREEWAVLPGIDADVQAFVGTQFLGLKADDAVVSVRKLCLASAEHRLQTGDKDAADDVAYWGGKLEAKAGPTASGEKPAAGTEAAKDAAKDAADDAEQPAVGTDADEPSTGHREQSAKSVIPDAGNISPQDAAEWVWSFVADCEDSEDVLERLLTVAKAHVSKPMVAAIDAFRLVLDRQRTAAKNGKHQLAQVG